MLDGLAGERVLELGREDGDAVQEESEVDALLGLLAEVELAHDGEEVGRVETLEFLVEAARWLEIGEPELAARVPDAVPQDVERAPPGDLARETAQERVLTSAP